MNFRIIPLGDQALIVEFADRVEARSARWIHTVCGWLAASALPGVSELVPAATTVTLFYSAAEIVAAHAPEAGVADWLAARVRKRLATLPASEEWPVPRLVEIPV